VVVGSDWVETGGMGKELGFAIRVGGRTVGAGVVAEIMD